MVRQITIIISAVSGFNTGLPVDSFFTRVKNNTIADTNKVAPQIKRTNAPNNIDETIKTATQKSFKFNVFISLVFKFIFLYHNSKNLANYIL